MVYQGFKLYIHDTKYVIEPNEINDPNQVIIFHRDAGSIELSDKVPTFFGDAPEVISIAGIMGLLRLLSGDVLVAITSSTLIGSLQNKSIYKINTFELFPFARNHAYLTEDQAGDEEKLVTLLRRALNENQFYYAINADMTSAIQMDFNQIVEGTVKMDEKFCWNYHLLKPFLEITKEDPQQNFSNFLVTVMSGFVSIHDVQIDHQNLKYGIVSRRASDRFGTRYFSRGIDKNGNVSNYVETEQILEITNTDGNLDIFSHLQVRGSIPLFWAQVTNGKYTPTLKIVQRNDTIDTAKLHFKKMNERYNGKVGIVNLVNQKGYELPIFEEFSKLIKDINSDQLIYFPFDFHKECSKMRWHRIQLLIDQLKQELENHSYYHFNTSKGIISQQKGVIRTNCMDCLDRTNVVQSLIAKTLLTAQLQSMSIEPNYSTTFNFIFNNVWADHADAVSQIYSGTGALKTDFTRTGQRTKAGLLQDGLNSLMRYIKNNYLDGSRQDAIDLLLGRYLPSQSNHSPFNKNFNPIVIMIGFLFFASVSLLWATYIFGLIPLEYKSLSGLISFSSLIASLGLLLRNLKSLVDRPTLVKFEYDEIEGLSTIEVEKGTLFNIRDKKD